MVFFTLIWSTWMTILNVTFRHLHSSPFNISYTLANSKQARWSNIFGIRNWWMVEGDRDGKKCFLSRPRLRDELWSQWWRSNISLKMQFHLHSCLWDLISWPSCLTRAKAGRQRLSSCPNVRYTPIRPRSIYRNSINTTDFFL